MADIRINALATTASTTASDDFLPVDGTTNGTRKLSAYSPTFGGNFQANGTGTIGGNLTVSGTTVSVSNNSSPRVNFSDVGTRDWFIGAQSGSDRLVFGTSVTSSGGHALRITSDNNVAIPNGNLTVSGGTVTSGSGTLTLNSSANTVVLQSAGTTALTLDSSQNATFAANVTASGQIKSTYSADYGIYAAPSGGANRNIAIFGVSGSTNGMTVKWDHASTTMRVNIANLPTSATGLAAGDLYNSAGTLKIA